MAHTRARLFELSRNPKAVPAAIIRRVTPRSPTHGFPWLHLPDGSVTFHERGFVSAPSPAMLLARHNFEVLRIRRELAGWKGRRGLEIGCGYGRLSMVFAEFSEHHIAVDINDDALTAARSAYPQIDFRSGHAVSLPFPNSYFDLVTTWTVLQHVPPGKIETALAEVLRVLAPGGTLLLCEETRDPEGSGGHAWHRPVSAYASMLSPARLIRHGVLVEIDRIPGLRSPGEVLVFRYDHP